MLQWLIPVMIFSGAALMVYNIYRFLRFALFMQRQKAFTRNPRILYIPVVLLVFFLLGYLFVGVFGKPDAVVASILFFGSIFVFVMYLILRGVTERLLENERLEIELGAAEAASRAKSTFLASVSHEIRTPLNVILGLDHIALRGEDLSPDTRTHLEKIDLSARHLMGLVNNILDMNRIETGVMEVKQEPFALCDALSQVNAIAQTQCEAKGLTYVQDVEGRICQTYEGDETLLKEVLLHILDNAVKYTDAPGTVRFAAGEAAVKDGVRTLRFTVSDTGVGMDKAFLDKVFDVFTKEDTTATDRYGGGGLSMAVTKRYVELMGGTIAVESEKGVGTNFTVEVPIRYRELPPPPPSAEPLASLEGRRVLIVEDVPENAEIAADLLDLEDVVCEFAENGQIAVQMVSAAPIWHYDAILMDLRMPIMDGLESSRSIRGLPRADAPAVPIIALTANAFESDVQSALAAGMNAHLAKPVDAEKLYQTLRVWMARADAERSAT